MLGGPQQGGEAGPRVEAREAEPVDRPVAGDQGRRLAVADQGIVLDAQRHGVLLRLLCAEPPRRTHRSRVQDSVPARLALRRWTTRDQGAGSPSPTSLGGR